MSTVFASTASLQREFQSLMVRGKKEPPLYSVLVVMRLNNKNGNNKQTKTYSTAGEAMGACGMRVCVCVRARVCVCMSVCVCVLGWVGSWVFASTALVQMAVSLTSVCDSLLPPYTIDVTPVSKMSSVITA